MKCFLPVVYCVLIGVAWGDTIRIDVRPGRRACGEETQFRVFLEDENGSLRHSGVGALTLDDCGKKRIRSATVDFSKENPKIVCGTLDEPGFLRLMVDVKGASPDPEGRPYSCSVPYENERISPATPEPRDFKAFWRETLAEQERIPADVRFVEEPSRSTEEWTMYRLSLATIGRRVHSWVSIPKGKGQWPVRVELPGSGCGPWSQLMEGCPDKVKMLVTVFPYEPSCDMKENERRYDEMNAAYKVQYGVPRYVFAGMDVSREACFYRPVIAGAVRAVRWLVARPEADCRDVSYFGSSQGGGCGFAVLALANDVFTSAVLSVPAMTDPLRDLGSAERSGYWPHCYDEWFPADPAARDMRVAQVLPYFDACNFAPELRCPVTVIAGLSDRSCPPSGICAAYNRIPSGGKRLFLASGGQHHTAWRVYCEMATKEAEGCR